jgi:outer membrane protein assembly factor BamC
VLLKVSLSVSLKVLFIACSMLMLGACARIPFEKVPGMHKVVGTGGMFRDRKEDYLQAGTIPRTEIPSHLDSFVIDDLLVIPDLPENPAPALPDPPRPIQVDLRSSREVIVQRMGTRSWIIAEASPSQVWPKLRDYWRQSAVPLNVESPDQGLMETGWFVMDGNVLTREKFRIFVENGFQNNSSEIRLQHLSGLQAIPVIEQVNWPAESMDADIAYDFTLDLSRYLADLADSYQASTASLLATSLSGAGKANLVQTRAGNEMLRLRADYDRSWAAVRRVLTRGEIEIIQEDQGLGVIDVRFDPNVQLMEEEEEGPGFFKRMVTLNGRLGKADTGGTYLLRLQLLQSGEHVEVLAVPYQEAGSAAGTDAANTLVRLLRNRIV